MDESWVSWRPGPIEQKKYYIDAVFDTEDSGFRILLSAVDNQTDKIAIVFKDWVWSYRWVEEVFTTERLDELAKSYGDDFFKQRTFFKISNSRYVKQLSKESSGIIDYYGNAQHFCFISSLSILDIVASYDPTVEMVQKGENKTYQALP